MQLHAAKTKKQHSTIQKSIHGRKSTHGTNYYEEYHLKYVSFKLQQGREYLIPKKIYKNSSMGHWGLDNFEALWPSPVTQLGPSPVTLLDPSPVTQLNPSPVTHLDPSPVTWLDTHYYLTAIHSQGFPWASKHLCLNCSRTMQRVMIKDVGSILPIQNTYLSVYKANKFKNIYE